MGAGASPDVANGRLRHMLIGYARVSKTDGSQSLDLQRDALRAAGIDDATNLYHDFASGVRDDRPGLDSCLRALRKGDVLVVWKLDRLGRNLAHLVNTVQDLSARGVGLRVLAGQGAQIDTTTAAGRLVFGIFAALAEFERELIRERTVAGLKAARARGRKGRQEVRAVESPSAAGPGRDGAPRHVGVRDVPGARHQAGDALPVRRAPGPAAGAGPEGPRLLNRSAWAATSGGHRLSVGFRPLPQTTRLTRRALLAMIKTLAGRGGAPAPRPTATTLRAPLPSDGRRLRRAAVLNGVTVFSATFRTPTLP